MPGCSDCGSGAGDSRDDVEKPQGPYGSIGVLEPLMLGMCLAGPAAPPEGDRRYTEGHGHVGVSRSGRCFGLHPVLAGGAVTGLDQLVPELRSPGGALADQVPVHLERAVASGALLIEAGLQCFAQTALRPIETVRRLRSEVEFDPAFLRDGVDARSRSETGGGQSGSWVIRQIDLSRSRDETPESHRRVDSTPVRPGVAAGPAYGDSITPASKGLRDDPLQAATVDGDECASIPERSSVPEQVFHPTEITSALFTHREG